ncbi:MAG TPA: hypothetical protein VLH40_08645 [Atribacteraceae bacterium]|nr:hypothetical protein [Atribacteraceae bacterium]
MLQTPGPDRIRYTDNLIFPYQGIALSVYTDRHSIFRCPGRKDPGGGTEREGGGRTSQPEEIPKNGGIPCRVEIPVNLRIIGISTKTAREFAYFTNKGVCTIIVSAPLTYRIGSGIVEAGCRVFIGQRLKRSGMFWDLMITGFALGLTRALGRTFQDEGPIIYS